MTSFAAQESETILKPYLKKYVRSIDNGDWARVERNFHPNGVLVFKDKDCVYGNKAVVSHMTKLSEITGKSVTTLFDMKYDGTGDYIIVNGYMASKSEKPLEMKAKFIQIWKKEGNRYYVFHDQV